MKEKVDEEERSERNKNTFAFLHGEQKHKHLNTQFPNMYMMKGMKGRVRPKGVSAEVVGMVGNKENGKAGKGSGEPFPNVEGNAGMELSEKEIMKILQAQQQYEKALEMARKYEEIMKSAEEKKKEIRPKIFEETKKKYGMNEKEIRQAFKERERKKEIFDTIINAIEKEGSKACENKQIRESMDAWKRIRTVEQMEEEDVKKIAVFMDEARKYLEEKTAAKGKKEIHHTGRMNTETLQILKHVKENGGMVGWKDLLRYGKEELGLDTDTFNKRRWTLLTKGYIEREGADVKLTPKGYARLEEEGY